METYQNTAHKLILLTLTAAVILSGCTKYGKGFLSPTLQYAVNQFTIKKGTVSSSYSIITDGSSIPLHIKWTHIYDASGKVVDTLFSKTYPVGIWTAAYNSVTDTTYAKIVAKRAVANLQPIIVNESNGTLQSNSGTIYLPSGTYTMDLEVSNIAGTEKLEKIISIILQEGQPLETSPEIGNFSNSLLIAGTATGAPNGTLFNGVNNPFVDYTVKRLADTPNYIVLKVSDKNGVPFNPKTGELTKRPNSGLNPTPPFLQNLQDYAPDTFVASDSAISLKYPLTPFPINSLGNGYNMYYRIPTQFVRIDSTSTWSSNTAGNLYKGTTDSHYKGVYRDGQFDYAIRIPMRVQVPGSYEIKIKILNATHS